MTIREIKSEARQCLREAKKRPYVLTLLFVLCMEGVTGIFNLLDSLFSTFTVGGIGGVAVNAVLTTIMTVLSLGIMLLQTTWSCHYSNFSVKLSRGREVSFSDFLAPFRIFGSTLMAMLSVYLKIFLRILIDSFLIALVILVVLPFFDSVILTVTISAAMLIVLFIRVYMVMYRYYFVFQALYDGDGCPAAIALKRSEALTKGNRMFLFRLDLSFLWYTIPLLLPTVVTLLRDEDLAMLTGWQLPVQWIVPAIAISWIIPIVMEILFLPYVETTKAVAYNHLRSRFVTPQEPEAPQDAPILLQEPTQNIGREEPPTE